MKDSILAIILLILALVLLGVVFFFNTYEPLAKFDNPVFGEGLGNLCDSEEDCMSFCQNNMGRCNSYCGENPENDLCRTLFETNKEDVQEYSDEENVEEIKNEDNPPILKNFGFNIEPWDKNTNLAGDLIFDRDIVFEDENILSEWVFVEFGGMGQRKSDPESSNIEYWFFVPLGTRVQAPVDGIVEVGFFEHTKDWGINFHPEGSDWIVSFEHVVNVSVQNGDKVKVGDIVAKAAPRINDNIAMTELAVWKGGQNIFKYCPFDFLDESLKSAYEEKINRLASDWEKFIGKDVYKEEDWVAPGCLVHEIQEK